MPLSDAWALELLVAAFAGGAFGAAIGALPSFAHADRHLDPPAASIVVTSALLALLTAIGVFPAAAWIPLA